MTSRNLGLLFLVVAVLGAPEPTAAEPIRTLGTVSFVSFPFQSEVIVADSSSTEPSVRTAASGAVTFSNIFEEDFTAALYELKAISAYGRLQSSVALTGVSGRSLSPLIVAGMSAEFFDTLTITGGTGAGFFSPTFHLDGRGFNSSQPSGFGGPVGTSQVSFASRRLARPPRLKGLLNARRP